MKKFGIINLFTFVIMRRLLPIIIFLLAVMSASADYCSMKFTTLAGEAHIVQLEGMRITFADNMLNAVTPEATLQIPVADIDQMEFSEETPNTNAINALDVNKTFEVFNANGLACGTFKNAGEAIGMLAPGVYVIKYEDGFTAKIIVK